MKNIVLPFALPLFLLGIFIFKTPNTPSAPVSSVQNNDIVACGAYSYENIELGENGKYIVPLPGWGHYSYPISTVADSAQFYFNQGLNMYYSYHSKEAIASFKEAARFDTNSAMAYWGEALAMGPGYNSVYSYTIPDGIPAVLQKMNEHISQATEKEKKFIVAMNSRYPADITIAPKKTLSVSYAQAMKELIALYPEDADIKALYVDAVMLVHPWDFWNNDGTAKQWTPELVQITETALKTNAEHPAFLHYYIHLTEASRHPEVALSSADALQNLLPGVAHMVHMSSHEYERNGLFAKGVAVNDKADDNLLLYNSLATNISLNKHSPHYFAVQTYCALSGAMYEQGMKDAIRCRKSVSPVLENTYDQYLYMLPALTLVRLGKWEEIITDTTTPDSRWAYAMILHHFAKGLAYVYTGHTDSAAVQLTQLRSRLKDTTLTVRRVPFNTALQGAGVAEGILNAAILFSQKKNKAAIKSLKKSIYIEDHMIYTEPSDWPIPARQFLGAYLLKLGKPAKAEKVYREDLIWNPANGWSLIGLSKSLEASNKKENLEKYKAQYGLAFSHAEQLPISSVFMP